VPVFDSGKSGVTHWFYRGDTALHLCAAAHRVELARRLLRRGAEVNARNFREGTLVRLAVQSTGAAVTADSPAEQREIVKLLSRPGRESESEKLARQNADGWARAESNLRLHWRSSVVPRLVSGVG
jgi:ankyrin repeat protein